MSGDNPKLILEGRKTQTRRIVKPQPDGDDFAVSHDGSQILEGAFIRPITCPYGVAGDRLYVRESFFIDHFEYYPHGSLPKEKPDNIDDNQILYRADGTCCEQLGECDCEGKGAVWRPSIHMPRWASRMTLEILKVRVERLQDISEEDAKAEGVDRKAVLMEAGTYRRGYANLWDSLHGKGAWDKNPWVWVTEFKQVERPNTGTSGEEKQGEAR